MDSDPRNEEFNDIVDVHVGHVDAPRVAISLFYFDVSPAREILFWTRVFVAEKLTNRPLVRFAYYDKIQDNMYGRISKT